MRQWKIFVALASLSTAATISDSCSLIQTSSRRAFRRELPAVHFIYTTGCDDYQLTHSVVLDHSWNASSNTGRLTRIVTNCRDSEAKSMMARSPLSSDARFSVFYAEGKLDTVPSTGEVYPARARPHALQQWLRVLPPTENVIALLDPDFVFLQALSAYDGLSNVRDGQMVSTDGWSGDDDEPVDPSFRTGPIWLLTVGDFSRILPLWLAKSDEKSLTSPQKLMREQYAFQEAAQDLHVPARFDHLASANPREDVGRLFALHYYASYNYKAWEFHKALATRAWYADHFNNRLPPPLECAAPLLQEPEKPPREVAEAVMLSALIPAMNRAFRAYREQYCPDDRLAFATRGLAAYGLVRTMHPKQCPGLDGSSTRYLVELDDGAPVSWDTSRPLGGDSCSREAQGL